MIYLVYLVYLVSPICLVSLVFWVYCVKRITQKLSQINYLTGAHRPLFLPITNRATPTSAAKLTRQKEKGMPRMRGDLPFFCHT